MTRSRGFQQQGPLGKHNLGKEISRRILRGISEFGNLRKEISRISVELHEDFQTFARSQLPAAGHEAPVRGAARGAGGAPKRGGAAGPR